MGLYKADYPEGSMVEICDRESLERFMSTWKFHNRLQPEQLAYAAARVQVESVGYYHGGDVIYKLKGVPGVWHEVCLKSAGTSGQ